MSGKFRKKFNCNQSVKAFFILNISEDDDQTSPNDNTIETVYYFEQVEENSVLMGNDDPFWNVTSYIDLDFDTK